MKKEFTENDIIDFGKICSNEPQLQPQYLFEREYRLPKTDAKTIIILPNSEKAKIIRDLQLRLNNIEDESFWNVTEELLKEYGYTSE